MSNQNQVPKPAESLFSDMADNPELLEQARLAMEWYGAPGSQHPENPAELPAIQAATKDYLRQRPEQPADHGISGRSKMYDSFAPYFVESVRSQSPDTYDRTLAKQAELADGLKKLPMEQLLRKWAEAEIAEDKTQANDLQDILQDSLIAKHIPNQNVGNVIEMMHSRKESMKRAILEAQGKPAAQPPTPAQPPQPPRPPQPPTDPGKGRPPQPAPAVPSPRLYPTPTPPPTPGSGAPQPVTPTRLIPRTPGTIGAPAAHAPGATIELPRITPRMPEGRPAAPHQAELALVDPQYDARVLNNEDVRLFIDMTVARNAGKLEEEAEYQKLRTKLNGYGDYLQLGDRLFDMHSSEGSLARATGAALDERGRVLLKNIYKLVEASARVAEGRANNEDFSEAERDQTEAREAIQNNAKKLNRSGSVHSRVIQGRLGGAVADQESAKMGKGTLLLQQYLGAGAEQSFDLEEPKEEKGGRGVRGLRARVARPAGRLMAKAANVVRTVMPGGGMKDYSKPDTSRQSQAPQPRQDAGLSIISGSRRSVNNPEARTAGPAAPVAPVPTERSQRKGGGRRGSVGSRVDERLSGVTYSAEQLARFQARQAPITEARGRVPEDVRRRMAMGSVAVSTSQAPNQQTRSSNPTEGNAPGNLPAGAPSAQSNKAA